MGIDTKSITTDFFVAGSALPPDSQSYVQRSADQELFSLILEGKPCCVLAPSQMGKSSLMIRTVARLQKQQINAATIYLSGIDGQTEAESWFLGLANRLKLHLKLEANVQDWWAGQASFKPSQRFINFLRQVVLAQLDGPVVVFLDEIETMLGLKFAPDFWEALYQASEARVADPIFQRLTFVLLGVALPADLIKDSTHSPFDVAHKITLCDFSREEVQIFQRGLEATYPDDAEAILSRIFYWTAGQPYLTQKLCTAADEATGGQFNLQAGTLIDKLVEKLFLLPTNELDLNLMTVQGALVNSPNRRSLLALYRQVYEGQVVIENETLPDQNRLKLIGLVRTEKGNLKVRNMIYRQFFNLNWLKAHTPSVKIVRYLIAAVIVVALALTVVMGFAIYQQFQKVIVAQAQPFIDSFDSATDPTTRLASLAGLFNLPGYEEDARSRFFELTPADQLALFEQIDPHKSGPDLITVIHGIYTLPNLVNNEPNNTLLRTMTKPLRQLVDDPSSPGAVTLELEITQWLNGRDVYNQEQYPQAISAYNLAIELNDKNPAVFFDRGLAYTALDNPAQALTDFSTVLSLDENWQPQVQQALINNNNLYDAVWSEQDTNQAFIALLPTPTNTPIPTGTPSPTPTPSPTSTSTRRLPTAAPTATPTSTPAPIVAPPTSAAGSPATSTPSSLTPPIGAFTLIAPLTLDEPSYGPTTFQWQWSGALPADYGFEVRMWKDGDQPAGVHNAVLDNQNGNVKSLGNNIYQLQTDIKDAAGVKGNSGLYHWTVALVKISPKYKDTGFQATPAQMRFAAPGASGGGKDGGGGGGVGIE